MRTRRRNDEGEDGGEKGPAVEKAPRGMTAHDCDIHGVREIMLRPQQLRATAVHSRSDHRLLLTHTVVAIWGCGLSDIGATAGTLCHAIGKSSNRICGGTH